jgi:hypothetical protein
VFLSHEFTTALPLDVQFLSRTERGDRSDGLATAVPHDLYEHQVPAVGRAGTLVIFDISTFQRASTLGPPPAYRWLAGSSFRAREVPWTGYIQQIFPAHTPEMAQFLTTLRSRTVH